jgi:nucleoside-diphosphate-sugar epimerase
MALYRSNLIQSEIIEASLAAVWPHLDACTLNGKRIFITGGTGFFGLWLLAALACLNRDHADITVTVLSRDPVRFLSHNPHWNSLPWLTFTAGNVRDFAFPPGHFDMLIHAATDTSMDAHAQPLSLFDDIVLGSRRVLDFAINAGVTRSLLISSGAVYGPQPLGFSHIPDDAAIACQTQLASSAYGEGKRVMEMLGSLYQHQSGIESIAARCFAFVGPGLPLDGHFAIGNFIHDALFADTIRVKGDGSVMRSYLYGADLAVWLLHLLANGQQGVSYNVGSDQGISIGELAFLVRDVLAPGKIVQIQNQLPVQNQTRNRYVPAIERAKSSLGLDVWTSIEDSLRQSARFIQAVV